MEKIQNENPILFVEGLSVHYGAIEAISDLSLNVADQETVTIIGPNGAGKTSLLSTISGIKRSTKGIIRFFGNVISNLPAHRIFRNGLVLIPERDKIFTGMSVYENLLLGKASQSSQKQFQTDLSRVYNVFSILEKRQKQIAGTLSGGEQQMLALGRALISHPKLLMMDEPSLGLAPMIVISIFSTIREMAKRGLPILLVEQNAAQAFKVAHKAYVIAGGKVKKVGRIDDLRSDPEVIGAYLGKAI